MTFALFFVFGVIFGSFANVLIRRLPINQSVFLPRSYCPSCETELRFYHNVPIFSWLFLGGKCAFCNDKISVSYPLVELFSGILALEAIGIESKLGEILNAEIIYKSTVLALTFINLLCLSLIDIAHKAVPDVLLFIGVVLALFYSPSLNSALYAAIFSGAFWLLRLIVSKLKGEEAMGSADIFIAGIVAVVLGPTSGLVAIYIAALATLPFYAIKKDRELAFVPFLSAGLLTVYCFKPEISTLIEKIYE